MPLGPFASRLHASSDICRRTFKVVLVEPLFVETLIVVCELFVALLLGLVVSAEFSVCSTLSRFGMFSDCWLWAGVASRGAGSTGDSWLWLSSIFWLRLTMYVAQSRPPNNKPEKLIKKMGFLIIAATFMGIV